MRKVLPKSFFARDTEIVAQELLGKFLIRKTGHREIAGMIVETEAYDGHFDRASHASRGRTPRTKIMFGPAGFFYVYLCYGIHYMLNIVTREKDYPGAVLIRGVEDAIGPGRVTKFFNINKIMNELPTLKSSGLWFEDRGVKILSSDIKKTPRIGVHYAGSPWVEMERRFILKKYFK